MPRNTKDDPPFSCGRTFCPAALRVLWSEASISTRSMQAPLGVTENAIRYRAELLGLTDQRKKHRRFSYSVRRFKELWADATLTAGDVAAAFGMSVDAVGRHARRLDLPPRQGGHARIIWRDDFTLMWKYGVRTALLAKMHDCNASAVRVEAVRRGLEKRGLGFHGISVKDYQASVAEDILAVRMAQSARITQMAYEITGRETRRHFAEIKRLAA